VKPIVFTRHARDRIKRRGTTEEDVIRAIRGGYREPARRGLFLYRLTLEYRREWDGRYYAVQQVAPVVDDRPDRFIVVTVFTFYFQEGEIR